MLGPREALDVLLPQRPAHHQRSPGHTQSLLQVERERRERGRRERGRRERGGGRGVEGGMIEGVDGGMGGGID